MQNFRPKARHKGLVVQEVQNEVLVYDTERYQAHCLNQSAASIWRLCDGVSTPEDIARKAGDQIGTTVGADVVWHALYQFSDFHLLEDTSAQLASVAPVSRRELMLTLTRVSMALPLVLGIAAPAAAQAASGLTGSTGSTGSTAPRFY